MSSVTTEHCMMAGVAKKSLDLTLRGSRLALLSSSSRSLSVAPSRLSKIQQIRSDHKQLTFARPISVSYPQRSDANKNDNSEVPVVPIQIIEHAIKDQLVLIDVRKPEEVAEFGKIPTANVLPVDDIESALKLSHDQFRLAYHFEKPLPSSLIVVYCRSGKRAARAGAIFRDQFGYKNVVNYQGSWLEWAKNHPEDAKVPPR